MRCPLSFLIAHNRGIYATRRGKPGKLPCQHVACVPGDALERVGVRFPCEACQTSHKRRAWRFPDLNRVALLVGA